MTRGLPNEIEGEIEGLVFDLDGTLVDSYRAIAESLNYARSRFDVGARRN